MKYLPIALALASTSVWAAAPANDSFHLASSFIGNAGTVSGTNIDATLEAGEPSHAELNPGRSVWWRWTPTAHSTVTIDTEGSTFDTVLAVYTAGGIPASPFNLLPLAYSDDIDEINLASRTSFSVRPNTTYYIAVAGYGGSSGSIKLNLSTSTGTLNSENDNYANRSQLSGEYTTAIASSRNATREPAENDIFISDYIDDIFFYYFTGDKSLWWTWTAPRKGTVTITNQMTIIPEFFGDDLNASIEVFRTNTNNIAELESDPFGNYSSNFAPTSTAQITVAVEAGEVLQLKTASYDAGLGANVRLTLEMGNSSDDLLNDRFVKRSVITSANASRSYNISSASAEENEPDHAGIPAFKSVWWTWIAPEDGYATIDTAGSSSDTTLAVYTGDTLASLTPVASSDDVSMDDLTSSVHIPIIKGTEYQIATDFKGDGDTTNLNITFISAVANIAIQPANLTAELDDASAPFAISNTGAPAIYNWQRKAAGTKTWVDYSTGVTTPPALEGQLATSTLTIAGPITADMDGDQFRCIITNFAGQVTSKPATLRVVSLLTYGGGLLNIALPTETGDTVTYYAKKLPKGLKLDRNTGIISGRLIAKPGTYTFTHWAVTVTGGVKTKTPASTYLLVVQPFPEVLTGSFEGLLQDSGPGLPVGKVQLNVTGTGAFTGSLVYNGKSYKLKNALALDSETAPTSASTSIALGGSLTLDVTIQNDATMLATLTDDGDVVGDVLGDGVALPIYGGLTPAAWAGSYTLALTDPSEGPEGSGYALVSIKTSGDLTLRGQLADGTKITAALKADGSPNGTYRPFLQPYKDKRGYLAGWLPLAERGMGSGFYHITALEGSDLYWAKPANAKDKAYPAGFGPAGLTALMEPWRSLPNNFLIGLLGLMTAEPSTIGDFTLTLDHSTGLSNGGANLEQLPVDLKLDAKNSVTVRASDDNPGNPRKWTVKINAKTGQFSGSLTLSDKRKVSAQGVLLQFPEGTGPNVFGQGFFLLPPVKTKPASGSILSGQVQFTGPDIP